MKRRIRFIIMIILLTIGVGVLLYPDIMNWYESRRHVAFLQEYNEIIDLMDPEEIEYELERARVFNEGITDISVNDPWGEGANDVSGTREYYTLLNFTGNGVMGRIEIPRIDVDLPVFHGSTSAVLDLGVGHMPHSSLPIGGYGNHSILTAHTGLVNSRLFTDLIELTYGDVFIVTVATNRIAFEVDRIDVVYPHEIDILQSYEDRDLITLVTCTPYGINSHRLLVRGTRVPYFEGMLDNIVSIDRELNIRHLAVIGMLAFVALVSFLRWLKRKRRKSKKAMNNLNSKHEKEYAEIVWE